MATKVKTRESNIELLRTLAMVMIIIHHLSQHNLIYKEGSLINQGIGAILFRTRTNWCKYICTDNRIFSNKQRN